MEELLIKCDQVLEHINKVQIYVDKGESEEFLPAIVAMSSLRQEARELLSKLKSLPPSEMRILEYISKMERI